MKSSIYLVLVRPVCMHALRLCADSCQPGYVLQPEPCEHSRQESSRSGLRGRLGRSPHPIVIRVSAGGRRRGCHADLAPVAGIAAGPLRRYDRLRSMRVYLDALARG